MGSLAKFVGVDRPGYELSDEKRAQIVDAAKGISISFVTIEALEISSSELRRRLAEGKSIRYLTPQVVVDHVMEARVLSRGSGAWLRRRKRRRQSLPEKSFRSSPTSLLALKALMRKPFGSQSYKHMKGLLMQRVNPSRYVHSISVAKTARKLARVYGYDEHIARMAGLLHDWDKALLPAQLQQRISDFDLKVSPDAINGMPWVLHGPTAAAVLRRDFPCFGEEVFQAIERHTVGAPDMAPLDMIRVFVAAQNRATHDVAEYKRCISRLAL